MDQHTWTDPLCGECRAFPSTADSILGATAREVLRLAQREADLLARIAELEEGDERETRIVRLRDDLAAAKRANEILGGKVNELEKEAVGLRLKADAWDAGEKAHADLESRLREKEHQLALAKAAIAEHDQHRIMWGKAIETKHQQLAASESRGRQYALELAEKAEEIRSLQDQVVRLSAASLLAAANVNQAEAERDAHREESARRLEAFRLADRDAHQLRKLAAELREDSRVYGEQKLHWTADNQRLRGLVKVLEAAIEDGIAHVEQARTLLDRFGADWHAKTMDALDLAHEALSGAGRPQEVKEWTDPAAVHLAWIVEERAAARAKVGPTGAAPGVEAASAEPQDDQLAGRLARLEERVDIAVSRVVSLEQTAFRQSDRMDALDRVLTDHADRLKAAEKSLAFLTRREPDVEDRLKLGEGRAEGLDLRVRDLHQRVSAIEQSAGQEE